MGEGLYTYSVTAIETTIETRQVEVLFWGW